ncbi:cytochrome c oxidase subunit VI [Heterostelium album PN500]|uniref:Cytochrome c oxidase subunit VI n=1 Tax=Heterostelium pallidum (strain ATCC 26659 / Pp 5 / PN500) TaxID=670386 RepID=D3AZK9_HETP5|nr:cytochrome c oxidase subunit VI [Heterostelium album PN500]EFA85388.1 cytochrome c oxidase subunit VI [Heterostelium album PN500]|eukprot:XP_020437497.1 cytochrome c oxidase subunit VI [Heterostelium album PN500]
MVGQEYKLRFPRGFHAYPFNTHKLEGAGLPKGYLTLIGVAATMTAAFLVSTGVRTNKRPHVTHNAEWEAATIKYAHEVNADPIYRIPHEKKIFFNNNNNTNSIFYNNNRFNLVN